MSIDENDRELLELAAKAAWIALIDWHDDWAEFGPGYRYEDSKGSRHCWNPLDDDGDALRLAVKLRMDVRIGRQNHTVTVGWGSGLRCVEEVFDAEEAEYVATRRAVTRAAAEIGKAMP